MCHSGVTCFVVANEIASALYAAESKTPPYPVMMLTMKREPARFPKNVTNQWITIFKGLMRRVTAATVVNMKEPVQRSRPVTTMMHKPYGKIMAPMVRMSPGAFSWKIAC